MSAISYVTRIAMLVTSVSRRETYFGIQSFWCSDPQLQAAMRLETRRRVLERLQVVLPDFVKSFLGIQDSIAMLSMNDFQRLP